MALPSPPMKGPGEPLARKILESLALHYAQQIVDLAGKQPLDADLTKIAGLTATTNNVIQSVASAWESRTPAQLMATLPAAVAAGAQGALLGTDKSIIDQLGDTQTQAPAGNTAVAAATVTQIAGTISLTEGTWLVYGGANILMGAGASAFDIYVRQGAAQVGKPTGQTLAAGASCTLPVAPLRVVVPAGAPVTYNLACFSTLACTARNSGGAGGFVNLTYISATYVGGA